MRSIKEYLKEGTKFNIKLIKIKKDDLKSIWLWGALLNQAEILGKLDREDIDQAINDKKTEIFVNVDKVNIKKE